MLKLSFEETIVNITQGKAECKGIKFSIQDGNGEEIARVFLYVMFNDLHKRSFGLIEDLFVSEKKGVRGQGLGTSLIKKAIKTAKVENCYKLLATSRYSRDNIHGWYNRLGFQDYGKEFRMDL